MQAPAFVRHNAATANHKYLHSTLVLPLEQVGDGAGVARVVLRKPFLSRDGGAHPLNGDGERVMPPGAIMCDKFFDQT
jgi:hypothetical protein